MLEIPLNSRRGFVYLNGTSILDDLSNHVGYKTIATGTYEDLRIMTVEITDDCFFYHEDSEAKQFLPEEIRCLHNSEIAYESLNLLPQDGWEELIDCWSCHNCEFKTMLGLNPRPRKKGILVSDLFFLINNADLPSCCWRDDISVRKLFYNEVSLERYSHDLIMYAYLDSYFSNRNTLLLTIDGQNYEIKYFYKAMLINPKDGILSINEAMKIGIKRTDKLVEVNNSINEFYSKLIYNSIISNAVGVKILEYKVSFVARE